MNNNNNIIIIDPIAITYISMTIILRNDIKAIIKELIKDAPTISLSELDDDDD